MLEETSCWEKKQNYNVKDKVKLRLVVDKISRKKSWRRWMNSMTSPASSGTRTKWSERELRRGQSNQRCRPILHNHRMSRKPANQHVRNLSRKIRTNETHEKRNRSTNTKLLKKGAVCSISLLKKNFKMHCLILISIKNHQPSSLNSMSPSLQPHHLGVPR